MSWPRAALVALLALATSAATCDLQDYSAPEVVQLRAGSVVARRGFVRDDVARLSLDYAVVNDGPARAGFRVSAQAQTGGDPDARACAELLSETPRPVVAPAPTGGAQPDVDTIRDLDRAHQLQISGEGAIASVDVRIRESGLYRFYLTTDVGVRLTDVDGAEQPIVDDRGATCTEATRVVAFDLNDGTYRLDWEAVSARLLVSRDCSDLRTVPGTCPGAASDLVTFDTELLEPSGAAIGHIAATELGIGNAVVVALECSALSAACAGSLEVVLLAEELECQVDSDCRASESCDDEGFCVRTPAAGCAAAGPQSGGGLAAGACLVLIATLARARRVGRRAQAWPREHRIHAAAWILAAMSPLLDPRSVQAAPTEVAMDIGVRVSRFAGTLGAVSSRGVGVVAEQSLTFGGLSAFASLGTDYRLTNQAPPPIASGLQSYDVAVGGAVALPRISRWLAPAFRAEYVLLGVISNPLSAQTGDRLRFHGVGAGVDARVVALEPMFVELGAGVRVFAGMGDVSPLVLGSVRIGIAGRP